MAVNIPLTQHQVAVVDDEDAEKVNRYKWYFNRTVREYGYAAKQIKVSKNKQTELKMHNFIMNTPRGMVVDHINHNTLDNRKVNLRICSPAQNRCNTRTYRSNKLGIKGVSYHKKRYRVRIQINKNPIFIGNFNTLEQAKEAYYLASKKYHKEFACQ